MSSQRLILAYGVLATLAVVAQCEDAFFGEHQPGDVLAKTRTVVETPAEPDEILIAGDIFEHDDGRKITAIELVDRNGDKSDTNANIVDGGPGKAYAIINIESTNGLGIYCEIKYYAI